MTVSDDRHNEIVIGEEVENSIQMVHSQGKQLIRK